MAVEKEKNKKVAVKASKKTPTKKAVAAEKPEPKADTKAGVASVVKAVKKEKKKTSSAKKVATKEKAPSVEKASPEVKDTAKEAVGFVEKAAPVKKIKRAVPEVNVYVQASFNNTIITITDPEGAVLAASSPGVVGFKGTKKSTAFAATKAAEDAAYKAQKYGIREAKVYISGPGPGRNAAVKGLDSAGVRITLLSDITPLPHNGCRPRKMPRK